jgi:tRNA A-37 threonylcarbamoyl transferase component Bud32
MTSHSEAETLLRPQKAAHKATSLETDRGLSTEILSQSARRLRVLALIYAFTFFMAAFFPNLLFAAERRQMMAELAYWLPDMIAIAMALLVALFTRSDRVSLSIVMNVGLAFLVASNYGIAVAEYINPARLNNIGWQGLSWVAVWTALFTVVVPTRPSKALIATLASLTSVPVVIGFMIASGRTTFRPSPEQFFFWIVFPYLLVAILAYVGQCVVYGLGKEVTRAQKMGSYRLVERLGEGGMGEVWRAKHRFLARPAAIKLMRPEVLAGSSVERQSLSLRFEREAQATASMRSSHTIELYDFGIADDGTFYYVMEFLDGFDLQALIDRFGPIPPERAVHLLTQVCHSLAEAHGEGLIHRDVKPANVYVCRHGREVDFVKVLDFGLVKLQNDASGVDINLTLDHSVGGTPSFMPPEQVLGDRPLDGRSDIYAVGCLAYWLVTGRLVFTGRTAMEIMLQHAQAKPTPPSQRTELALPQAFDHLIMACLEKNPDDRPATAEILATRLATIETTNAWTPAHARQWWDVHHPKKPRVA